MKQSTYRFLVIFLSAVIVICGGLMVWRNGQSGELEGQVEAAPDFTMTDDSGEEVRLSDFMGKPVVVNFFATWCGPCKSELPYFQSAYEDYGDQVQFLMVDMITFNDSAQAVEELVKQRGYTFPVYYDRYGEAAVAYEVTAIPVTLFIGADGTLADQHLGMMTRDQLEDGIQALLNEFYE